jgi:hypothetical protein
MPKKPTLSNLAFMQLSTLPAEEQVGIRKLIESETGMRKLAKTADRVGPNGCYMMVNGTPDTGIVFDVSANGVKIESLISRRAIDLLPVVDISKGPNGSHKKHRRTTSAKSIKV